MPDTFATTTRIEREPSKEVTQGSRITDYAWPLVVVIVVIIWLLKD